MARVLKERSGVLSTWHSPLEDEQLLHWLRMRDQGGPGLEVYSPLFSTLRMYHFLMLKPLSTRSMKELMSDESSNKIPRIHRKKYVPQMVEMDDHQL